MPAQASLQASPATVIVDIEAGDKSGSTQVEYSKEVDYVVWHRWRAGAWLKVSLQVTSPDDPALTHGYFSSPKLEPGMVYQAAIWESKVDPNRLPSSDMPPRALASITVFALRKRPDKREFFSDENQSTGGTYRLHQIATTVPVYAYMAVSTDTPQRDGEGYMSFGRIDGEVWQPLNQSFFLEILDLLPGTEYNELIRLSDQFGNWEFLSRKFTTLKRRIRLEPTDLYIVDDSDDFSNGEGDFKIILSTGTISQPASWERRGDISYSNNNLESGKSTAPPPSGMIIVPPESVSDAMRHVRIEVYGQEDDSGSFLIEDDDTAWGAKDLFIPSRTTDEVVSNRADSVSAAGDDDLQFTLSFKYWIEYF